MVQCSVVFFFGGRSHVRTSSCGVLGGEGGGGALVKCLLCSSLPAALHTAFQVGHVGCAQILLEESEANLGAVNNRCASNKIFFCQLYIIIHMCNHTLLLPLSNKDLYMYSTCMCVHVHVHVVWYCARTVYMV